MATIRSNRMVSKLTTKRLKEVLHYDPETGKFTWLLPVARRVKKGSPAGTLQRSGFIHIRIDGEQHNAHRLAYFYMKGYWPEHEIAHINKNKSDNRWANIRHVTRSQNMVSRRRNSNNTSGHRNICLNKTTKEWQVHISRESVLYRKNFRELEDAIRWRDETLATIKPISLD